MKAWTKKRFSLLGCVVLCTPLIFSSFVACGTENVPPKPEPGTNSSIPPEKLDIRNGVLYGFAPGVTMPWIKEQNFDTLEIPLGVHKIQDFAFAFMFDNITSNIQNLILNDDLVEIGAGAFLNCYGFMNNLVLPQTLEVIGSQAFRSCNFINSLTLPKKLKTIGSSAFRHCTNLTGFISIPDTIENIEEFAFAECVSITNIYLDGFTKFPPWMLKFNWVFWETGVEATQNNSIVVDSFETFTKDQWLNILQNRQKLDTRFELSCQGWITDDTCFDIDPGAKKINKFKLSSAQLKSYDTIKIPDNIEVIGENAFCNDDGTQGLIVDCNVRLVFNDKLKTIEKNAFKGCTGIHDVLTLPDSLETVGEGAFSGCTGLYGTLSLPSRYNTINPDTFSGCTSITSVVFGSTTLSCGERSFQNCINLSIIDISSCLIQESSPLEFKENAWTNIAPYGNIYCKDTIETDIYQYIKTWFESGNLLNIELAKDKQFDANWSIGRKIEDKGPLRDNFYAVKNATDLVSLSKIGLASYRDGYTTIVLPEQVANVEMSAFDGIFSDQGGEFDKWMLNLKLGLISIGKNAFGSCNALYGPLVLPDSLKTIGDYAFQNCIHLKGPILLPWSVETLGTCAFMNCTSLSSHTLVLPSSLKEIGSTPFMGLSIEKIIVPSSIKKIGDNAFSSIQNFSVLNLASLGPNIPDWILSSHSFRIDTTIAPAGKVIVHPLANLGQWTIVLRGAGLPTSWEVTYSEADPTEPEEMH